VPGEPMSPARTITDEELLQLPKDGNKYEVVDGELVVMSPAGMRHEGIVMEVGATLRGFVNQHRLGRVFAPDLLYVRPSGNKRGPDVSFIAAHRLAELPPDTVFPAFAPDLAVEVLSPSDRPRRVLDKVGEYLEAGVRLVWVIDPVKRQAAVYRTATEVRYVDAGGVLDGEDVLPGFRCPLADLLV
jgi:Uma2 family endonuclease